MHTPISTISGFLFPIGTNDFEQLSVDNGQSREPEPPHKMTGRTFIVGIYSFNQSVQVLSHACFVPGILAGRPIEK